MSKRFLSGINVTGTATLNTVANAGLDTDKFLVLDAAGNIDFRTGDELKLDIGANVVSRIEHEVKLGETMTIGTPVYIGVDLNAGTNMTVYKATNATEAGSSKTIGLIASSGITNDLVEVVTEGLLEGLNTSTATKGDPVWLGVNGALLFGLANKPVAPAHMVFLGIVTRVQQNNGEIFVKVQNGFEMSEIHNYLQGNVQNNEVIVYESATSLYKPKSIPTILGYTPVPDSRTLTINGTTYDLSANRSWTITTDASARSILRYVATANQTTFTISGGYTPALTDVYRNGVKLDNTTDFTATNGTTIVLTNGASVNDVIEVYRYQTAFLANNALRVVTEFVATAGQTTFNVTYNSGLVDVFYNGSKLLSTEYTAGNGTSIILNFPCNVNDTLEVHAYSYAVGAFTGQAQLNGTGLVRMSGTTVTYDNATYATQSYVTTAVANLVNSAPATLDTLNELATALGNDANFATTITTSISTKQAQLNGTGFVKVSGTTVSYDNSTYLTSINSSQVTTALGYTPYNATNPSGYITSSALSAYLPLTGGTLTGALSGTSATFTNTSTFRATGNAYTNGSIILQSSSGATSTYLTNSGGIFYLSNNGSTDHLQIASTGAATFSSSVTATGGLISNGGAIGYGGGELGFGVTTAGATSGIYTLATASPIIYFDHRGTGNTGFFVFRNGSGGANTLMTIAGTGNVGIGTSSPSSVLEVAGTSSTSDFRISRTVSPSTYFYIKAPGGSPSASQLGVNGTDVMTLNANGNVGIGTSSPVSTLDARGILSVGGAAGTYSVIQRSTTPSGSQGIILTAGTAKTEGGGGITFADNANSGGTIWLSGNSSDIYGGGVNIIAYGQTADSNIITFATRNAPGSTAERMRITSGGNVLINTTSDIAGVRLQVNGVIFNSASSGFAVGGVGGRRRIQFGTDGANIFTFLNDADGYAAINASAFNVSSDYRLKQDFKNYDGLTLISAIKTYDYQWKENETRAFGVIAHELAEVIPYAVSGEKDAIREDGSIKPQSVDYSKLVPILIKSIQELEARIKQLENK